MIPATVLVVEDWEEILYIQDQQLTSAGYTVLLANSAAVAMAQLATVKVDVLFSDIRLGPGHDDNGLALAERASALYPELRIVLTSGYPIEGVNQRWPILQKPYMTPQVIEAFDRVLSGERQ